MDKDEAKSALIGNMEANAPDSAQSKDLDKLADDLLLRVAAFTGECIGHPDFCGFAIEELRDDNKMLTSLTLIPCDNIDGTAVRRVERQRRLR